MPAAAQNEVARLTAVRSYGPPDEVGDESIAAVVRVVAAVTESPMAAVSLVEDTTLRLVESQGLGGVRALPRAASFCGAAVDARAPLEVVDASIDARFAGLGIVTGAPHVRGYAGAPLIDADGFVLGTLCVLSPSPMKLTPSQRGTLQELAGVVVRLLHSKRDNRRRREAEASLRRVEGELRAIVQGAPTDISYWDADLRNRFANPRCLARFGHAEADARGVHFSDFVGEDCYHVVKDHIDRALAGEAQTVERTRADADGGVSHLQLFYVPHRVADKTVGFTQFAVDLTAHKRSALQAAAQHEFLQAMLDRIPNTVVAVLDEELRAQRVYGAPEMFAAMGTTREAFEGHTIAEFAPQNAAHLERACRRCLAGEVVQIESRREGRHLTHRLVPVTSLSGRPLALVVSQDLSDGDRLRDELARHERLVATGTLAAGIGHEVNNPLTYIVTNLELVQEAIEATCRVAPSEALRDSLEMIAETRDGVEHIRKIIQGLRAFSVTREGRVPVTLEDALRIAIEMSRHEIRPRAQLVLDLTPAPSVLGDLGQLAQVIVNLLLNAAQSFTDRDVGKNRINVRVYTDARGHAALEVQDNGSGIPADVLPRIFDPFFTTKAVGQGSGLGLSISHGLVVGLGGEIACDSTPGRGTTLRISFAPIAAEPAPVERGPSSMVVPRARILVIDDDPAVARSVQRTLGTEHEVLVFTDPRAALARLEADDRFDLVFCDLVMPHLTGMELFRAVRARQPALALRFLFMTGGVVRPDLVAFLEENHALCLEKPFVARDLRALVRARLAS
jgi:PAS domain S-box-containing protein